MNKLTKEQFIDYIVESTQYYLQSLPHLRLGQAYFVKLNEMYPSESMERRHILGIMKQKNKPNKKQKK